MQYSAVKTQVMPPPAKTSPVTSPTGEIDERLMLGKTLKELNPKLDTYFDNDDLATIREINNEHAVLPLHLQSQNRARFEAAPLYNAHDLDRKQVINFPGEQIFQYANSRVLTFGNGLTRVCFEENLLYPEESGAYVTASEKDGLAAFVKAVENMGASKKDGLFFAGYIYDKSKNMYSFTSLDPVFSTRNGELVRPQEDGTYLYYQVDETGKLYSEYQYNKNSQIIHERGEPIGYLAHISLPRNFSEEEAQRHLWKIKPRWRYEEHCDSLAMADPQRNYPYEKHLNEALQRIGARPIATAVAPTASVMESAAISHETIDSTAAPRRTIPKIIGDEARLWVSGDVGRTRTVAVIGTAFAGTAIFLGGLLRDQYIGQGLTAQAAKNTSPTGAHIFQFPKELIGFLKENQDKLDNIGTFIKAWEAKYGQGTLRLGEVVHIGEALTPVTRKKDPAHSSLRILDPSKKPDDTTFERDQPSKVFERHARYIMELNGNIELGKIEKHPGNGYGYQAMSLDYMAKLREGRLPESILENALDRGGDKDFVNKVKNQSAGSSTATIMP